MNDTSQIIEILEKIGETIISSIIVLVPIIFKQDSFRKKKFTLDKTLRMLYYNRAGNKDQHMEKSRSWPSAHDWKSCIPQKGIEGSNPSFSAI